jgi:hypothetical protein
VAAGEPNETRYLGKVFEDKDVQRDVDAYIKSIDLPRDANGMAVMIGGRVVGAELFGDSATFRKLSDKLVRSYAVDAIEYRETEKFWNDRALVERFLHRAEDSRLVAKETIGIGRFFKIEGGGLYGSVLVWHEQRGAHGVVHASLFDETPVVGKIEPPPNRPRPPIVPFER